jgi:hypothetical protein
MKGIIDRWEGEYAVVEIEGLTQSIPRRDLPAEAREGDVMFRENDRWIMDPENTAKLKQEIQALADEVWEK